ncbi:ATP-binding protein [Oerskovia sp. M15]
MRPRSSSPPEGRDRGARAGRQRARLDQGGTHRAARARARHPPAALDNGLAVALETLAARSPLPVTVDVDPNVAPSPAVETIAYFCVAELVTNAAKHARASGVYVLVEEQGSTLRLRVRDDGQGGPGSPRPMPRATARGSPGSGSASARSTAPWTSRARSVGLRWSP